MILCRAQSHCRLHRLYSKAPNSLKNLAQACIREISFYEFDKLAIAPGPIRQAPPSTGSFVEFVALGQQRIYPYEIRIAVDRDRRRAAQCDCGLGPDSGDAEELAERVPDHNVADVEPVSRERERLFDARDFFQADRRPLRRARWRCRLGCAMLR